jgi:nitrogen fixation protein NifU and related proteins
MSPSAVHDIYHATILERARRPLHQHRLEPCDAEVREVNPLCGDRVTLRLRRGSLGQIVAIGYEARACAICSASSDLLAELVPGMTEQEVRSLAKEFEQALQSGPTAVWSDRIVSLRLFAPLHDTPSRIGCATLPWHALMQTFDLGTKAY